MGIVRHNVTFYKIVNTVEDDFCEIAYEADNMRWGTTCKFADEVVGTIEELWDLEPAYFANFNSMFAEVQEGWMTDKEGHWYLVKMTDDYTITITA